MATGVSRVLANLAIFALGILLLSCGQPSDSKSTTQQADPAEEAIKPAKPNFLFILTDDQSAAFTSKVGYPAVSTPNFDKLANEGVYFSNAFSPSSACTASRSGILAGQHIWRLKDSANHWSLWSDVMISYQQLLKEAGYAVAFTGKGWGPGVVPDAYKKNKTVTGKSYHQITRDLGKAYSPHDYVANFRQFLDEKKEAQPFSFWMGIFEPHLPFDPVEQDRFKGLEDRDYIPDFLPTTSTVKNDLQAYLREIEMLDKDIGAAVRLLEEKGLLSNTVIVVTSDNGMPFSRAKSNHYLYGVNVPLAVYWQGAIDGGRDVDVPVSLSDIAPTFLEAAGINIHPEMTGKSLLPLLHDQKNNFEREVVYSASERMSVVLREGGVGYSMRALHHKNWLYIRNNFPDRWPLGDPPGMLSSYQQYLRDEKWVPLWDYMILAGNKRPKEELYFLPDDPYQMNNLAGDPKWSEVKEGFSAQMDKELLETGDPVFISGEDVFSGYPEMKR